MTTFFIDLFQDLREKRLWPVAVGLLAAIAAVPFVLFKPASAPPVQPPIPATTTAGPKVPVVTVDTSPTAGSKLLAFSEKNPFKPLGDLAAASPGSSSPSSASQAVKAATSGSGSPLASLTHLLPGSSSGGSSGGMPSLPTSVPATTHTTKWFRYVADVKFGAPGHLKTLKGITVLTLLPDAKQPVLTFMGATSGAASVLFFIADPTFTAHGKGRCNASGDACRFVTLTTTNNAETFDSIDGTTHYKLQLLRIYQQFFTPKSGSSSPSVKGASFDPSTKVSPLDIQQLVPEILSLTGGAATAASDAPQG